jgi:hypothetical protein
MSVEAQNIKIRHNSPGTLKNEYGITKLEKLDVLALVTPKMGYIAQNVKNRRAAHETAKNEYVSTKYKNRIQHIGTVKNEIGISKLENCMERPYYCRK